MSQVLQAVKTREKIKAFLAECGIEGRLSLTITDDGPMVMVSILKKDEAQARSFSWPNHVKFLTY